MYTGLLMQKSIIFINFACTIFKKTKHLPPDITA